MQAALSDLVCSTRAHGQRHARRLAGACGVGSTVHRRRLRVSPRALDACMQRAEQPRRRACIGHRPAPPHKRHKQPLLVAPNVSPKESSSACRKHGGDQRGTPPAPSGRRMREKPVTVVLPTSRPCFWEKANWMPCARGEGGGAKRGRGGERMSESAVSELRRRRRPGDRERADGGSAASGQRRQVGRPGNSGGEAAGSCRAPPPLDSAYPRITQGRGVQGVLGA